MSIQTGKRIYRTATPEEKARHQQIREQIAEELPTLQQRAKQKLAEFVEKNDDIRKTVALLKAERLKQGLTLTDMHQSTGIDIETLLQLEENGSVDPTITTLTRYADAVGKKMSLVLTPK